MIRLQTRRIQISLYKGPFVRAIQRYIYLINANLHGSFVVSLLLYTHSGCRWFTTLRRLYDAKSMRLKKRHISNLAFHTNLWLLNHMYWIDYLYTRAITYHVLNLSKLKQLWYLKNIWHPSPIQNLFSENILITVNNEAPLHKLFLATGNVFKFVT